MKSQSTYRPDIDGLRAIAVLSVLLFHLDISVFSGGFIGVDVFFVISGFLITRLIVNEINETQTFSFLNFYMRRIRRLLPAFLLVLFLTLVVASFIFSPADLQNLGTSAFYSIISVSNIFFWKEAGYFDEAIKLNPLLHTWSLAVEEQFYLVWPAVLLFVATRWGMPAVIKVLIAIILFSLLLNLVFDQRFILAIWPNTANQNLDDVRAAMFYLGPFRNFELGLGALLVFFISRRLENEVLNEIIFILGIILIVLPVFIFDENTVFPSYNALVPCVGTAMVIYAGNPKVSGRLINNNLAVGLGLISYSLYLVHWPIISLYKYIIWKPLAWNEQIALGVVSVFLAGIIYKLIEQPFRYPVKPSQKARSTVLGETPNAGFVKTIGVVSVIMLGVSAHMWATNGWLWRVDDKRSAILSQIDNLGQFHKTYFGGRDCEPHILCSVNKDQETNIYFIGDSHSHAYAYGLAKTFPDYKFTHLDNRCEYSTFDYCYAGKYQDSNFVKRKADDFEYLKSSNSPIIIAQNWGNKTDHFNTQTQEIVTFDNLKSYAQFLASELDKVTSVLGKQRVLVIGQVHRFGWQKNPLTCIGLPMLKRECDKSIGGFAFRLNQMLEEELQAKGVRFISPTDVMCEEQSACINLNKQGMPLFSDSNHLSIWGSEYVINKFKMPLSNFFMNAK